jgi:hypothetical protein
VGNVFKILTAGLLAGLAHSQANAATVVNFQSDGYFTNVSNCSGGNLGCSISIDKNVLKMSGATWPSNQSSTLTITDVTSPNITTNQDNYLIGKITWANLATYNTDQDFNVKYTFALTFSNPNFATDSQLFKLQITQPTNPTPDNIFNISQTTLDKLGPFQLNGVTVSDIHFVEVGDGWYNGSKWTNPEHGTSTLEVRADFTFETAAPPVPEPSTWAMMILGFAGVGFMAYRRKRGGNALTAA